MGQNIKKILFACVLMLGATVAANALTVTYDCGNSTGTAPTDSVVYESGDSVTVKPNTCDVPSGKHFAGYVCGSTTVASGNKFTISSNTTCTAQWENGKFAVKTANTPNPVNFYMTAIGTFYVDCGDGGTLTDDAATTTVSGNTITRTDTTEVMYTCTWASTGVHTITFDGIATGYALESAGDFVGMALAFYKYEGNANTHGRIASISGSLYNLFPQLGTATNQKPRFNFTFGSTPIKQIPDTLFYGYTHGARTMFYSTFNGCSKLTTIPSNLFAGLTSGAAKMFYATFAYCTSLTTIPSGLFTNITTGATGLFRSTFNGCSKLTTIPSNLFAGLTSGVTEMFRATFYNCTSLTTIPTGLFTNITTGATGLFSSTFSGCSKLTTIPSNLFAGLTSGAAEMFYRTFYNCTNLSGYIPPTFFGGLIANNTAYATEMMSNVFYNTGLATSCDNYNGTVRYVTPYNEYWDGHVSCGAPIDCTAGQYLPALTTTCATCSADNYCASGSYGMNIVDQGLTACSTVGDNSYTASDAGASADTQCYKTCTTSNVAHSSTVTGNDYYGTGVDTCAATACENGYHVDTGACAGNTISITWHGALQSDIDANNASTMIYGGDIRTPLAPDPSQIPVGKYFKGWKFVKSVQE